MSGVSELQLAHCFLLLIILQLYHLPLPFLPPVSSSSCLSTQCQLLLSAVVLYNVLFKVLYCKIEKYFHVCFYVLFAYKV